VRLLNTVCTASVPRTALVISQSTTTQPLPQL
jgi:hypothetical protein